MRAHCLGLPLGDNTRVKTRLTHQWGGMEAVLAPAKRCLPRKPELPNTGLPCVRFFTVEECCPTEPQHTISPEVAMFYPLRSCPWLGIAAIMVVSLQCPMRHGEEVYSLGVRHVSSMGIQMI